MNDLNGKTIKLAEWHRQEPVRLRLRKARDATAPASSTAIDVDRIAWAVREILLAVGEDPERDGLVDASRRVTRACRDLLAALRQDPAAHLGTVCCETCENIVVVRGGADRRDEPDLEVKNPVTYRLCGTRGSARRTAVLKVAAKGESQ